MWSAMGGKRQLIGSSQGKDVRLRRGNFEGQLTCH